MGFSVGAGVVNRRGPVMATQGENGGKKVVVVNPFIKSFAGMHNPVLCLVQCLRLCRLPQVVLQALSGCSFQLTGSMGGVMEAVCLQPVDTIKTRLQLDHSGKYKGRLRAACCWRQKSSFILRVLSQPRASLQCV